MSSSFIPNTAAIVPFPLGNASSINRPRVFTKGNASSSVNVPAATNALYSPKLCPTTVFGCTPSRSEEHTSELQSRFDLVCRLLLEKKHDNTAGRSRDVAGR